MPHARRIDKLLLVARHELVGSGLAESEPAVLLEGSWPEGTSSDGRWSLDEEIDAQFARIDQQASRLADRLAGPSSPLGQEDDLFQVIDPAWLDALGLRYYLVKLIRLVTYFCEVRPLRNRQTVHLVAAKGRDEDYADCVVQLCRLAGANCRVEWIDRPKRPAKAFPPNGRWRRALARLADLIELPCGNSGSQSRVVLCGNPRLLDPVCRELVRRDCRAWWLYDRFAVRSWLRWWTSGVGQLVCDSSESQEERLVPRVPESVEFRGVDLAQSVSRWTAGRLRTHGPGQTRILRQIDAHFRRVRPWALVLDEDATPMARAAVAIARRHGATSLVVQHGAPVCRFGFAPPAADRILVWGRSSQRQLVRWGVPPERIHVVGSPRHETLYQALSRDTRERLRRRPRRDGQDRRRRILLLATVPPRDDRPDAIALHLTCRTYAEMLRAALAAVSRIPSAELIVKLHPRAPDDPIARAVLSEFPSLRCRVVHRGPMEKWLRRADCVLSCLSSAGVDATLAGVPVIQLLPAGSGDLLPHREWGMLGTARSETELWYLLARALDLHRQTMAKEDVGWLEGSETHDDFANQAQADPDPDVFADFDTSAAARIVDAILAPNKAGQGDDADQPVSGGSDRMLSGWDGRGTATPAESIPYPALFTNLVVQASRLQFQ